MKTLTCVLLLIVLSMSMCLGTEVPAPRDAPVSIQGYSGGPADDLIPLAPFEELLLPVRFQPKKPMVISAVGVNPLGGITPVFIIILDPKGRTVALDGDRAHLLLLFTPKAVKRGQTYLAYLYNPSPFPILLSVRTN